MKRGRAPRPSQVCATRSRGSVPVYRSGPASRANYARTLYEDDSASLDDLREAVAIFEETVRAARRVLGGAHPLTDLIGDHLRLARASLHARETPPSPSPSESV